MTDAPRCWREVVRTYNAPAMPTPLDLDAIAARLAAATPGPWRVRTHAVLPAFVEAPRLDLAHPHDIEVLGEDVTLYPTRAADVTFIAHAPADIADLVDELTRLRARHATLRAVLAEVVDPLPSLEREAANLKADPAIATSLAASVDYARSLARDGLRADDREAAR